MWSTPLVSTVVLMTGRSRVVVLWDPEHDPPAGPQLDAAALATPEWDWEYNGPSTHVRPPTMVVLCAPIDDVARLLAGAEVVVGVPSVWTLRHVSQSSARFVAVVRPTASIPPVAPVEVAVEASVDGWPAPSQWPAVLDHAAVLDDGHRHVVDTAATVADDLRQLLAEISERHLPAAFRTLG